jgi:hypothetical protein
VSRFRRVSNFFVDMAHFDVRRQARDPDLNVYSPCED